MKNLTPAQLQELEEKMRELKLSSRQLPDSAMTTYFGKPAFHAYGHAHANPPQTKDKYKTHNINPHSGDNKPEYSQVHGRALLGGTVQVRGPGGRAAKRTASAVRQPVPPRVARPKVKAAVVAKHAQSAARN